MRSLNEHLEELNEDLISDWILDTKPDTYAKKLVKRIKQSDMGRIASSNNVNKLETSLITLGTELRKKYWASQHVDKKVTYLEEVGNKTNELAFELIYPDVLNYIKANKQYVISKKSKPVIRVLLQAAMKNGDINNMLRIEHNLKSFYGKTIGEFMEENDISDKVLDTKFNLSDVSKIGIDFPSSTVYNS